MTRPTPPVPSFAKLGAAIILLGLVADIAMHAVASGLHDGLSAGEHLAHLMVLIGMVVTIVGIVADGSRRQGREPRPERSPRDAVR